MDVPEQQQTPKQAVFLFGSIPLKNGSNSTKDYQVQWNWYQRCKKIAQLYYELFENRDRHQIDISYNIDHSCEKQLMEHQLKCFNSLCQNVGEVKNGSKMIIWNPGLGKSIPVILYSVRYIHKVGARILLLAPSSLNGNWFQEVEKWFYKLNLKPIWVNILKGSSRMKTLEDWNANGGLLIATIKKFWNLMNTPNLWNFFKSMNIHSLIIDEVHNLISTDIGIAMKVIDQILKQCHRKIFLTGTPFVGDGSMFGKLLHILTPNIELNSSSSVSAFRQFGRDSPKLEFIVSIIKHCRKSFRKLIISSSYVLVLQRYLYILLIKEIVGIEEYFTVWGDF
jgi:SNF2 family DNA or RNA helicase